MDKLRAKLIKMFGVKKVLFDSFSLGKEQGVLFCDIEKIETKITQGIKSILITGTLCICVSSEKMNISFFQEKASLSNDKELSINSTEIPLPFSSNGNEFIKNEVLFTYKTSVQFNQPYETFEGLEIITEE
jgi:hypothetical protein